MSDIKRVSPEEAKKLMDEGYTYVDVRTVEEFRARHPEGSLNVPLSQDFMPLMQRLFALDAKIVLGCAVGGRSLRAAQMLSQAGFSNVVDQRAGMEGAHGPFGGRSEPGWADAGLPVAQGDDAGSYGTVKTRAG